MIFTVDGSHLELLQLFLDHELDIHIENEFILRYESIKGDLEAVQFLLDHGANIHANNDEAL